MERKLYCPKCGGSNLSFTSIARSKKNIGFLIVLAIVIAVLVLFFLISFMSAGIDTLNGSKINDLDFTSLYTLFTIAGYIFDVIVIIFILMAFIKLIPYKNNNVIIFICNNCGHYGNIDDIKHHNEAYNLNGDDEI